MEGTSGVRSSGRRLTAVAGALALGVGTLLAAAGAEAAPGDIERVSVSSDGVPGNDNSRYPSVSGDARYVAFASGARNLVPGDTNRVADVFVSDRASGRMARVSVASGGAQANDWSEHPSVSADGRFVAFESWASNLVRGDSNGERDVFVHDRSSGRTARVSVSGGGVQGNGESFAPSVSADGRFVAFESEASNLVPGDTNGQGDVFVHDRSSGRTTRVSVSSGGDQGNDWSSQPSLSGDGRFVAFTSPASNLVPGDTKGKTDVFVHDRSSGRTTRVSVSSSGIQGNGWSQEPSLSTDGRYVAFGSVARNLVPGDTARPDVFVHDRSTKQTTRVSVSSDREQANGPSREPAISGDGRYVAFTSHASNLVPGQTNDTGQVYRAEPRWKNGGVGPSRCTITGTPGPDVLRGTPGPDVICGLGGNDRIYAYGGKDYVFGGPGHDVIYGGPGSDHLKGEHGNDTIHGQGGWDTVNGGKGRDRLFGNAGNDTFWAKDFWRDTVDGGDGTDRARIDRYKDTLNSVERLF